VLSLSLSLEYILLYHLDNKQLFYIHHSSRVSFDSSLIEALRQAIHQGQIALPQSINRIQQELFQRHNLLLRTGKYTVCIALFNSNPNRLMQDAVQSFHIRFESRWNTELASLYTSLQGNLQVFYQDLPSRPNVRKLIDEVFHAEFTVPYLLTPGTGSLRTTQLQILELAKSLIASRGYFFLDEILNSATLPEGMSLLQLADLVGELISRRFFTPSEKVS
jgi:hypothetical protein